MVGTAAEAAAVWLGTICCPLDMLKWVRVVWVGDEELTAAAVDEFAAAAAAATAAAALEGTVYGEYRYAESGETPGAFSMSNSSYPLATARPRVLPPCR